MIEHIKLNGYKGIESIVLNDLGQINVISGKNNSGKSSILEAMTIRDSYGLGLPVSDTLKTLFKPHSHGYSSPSPTQSNNWFNTIIDIEIQKNTVWYDSDSKSIATSLSVAMKQDKFMGQYDNGIFNFKSILQSFFSRLVDEYKPFLIPPKRAIAFEVPISTNEKIEPTGEGIINRIFYLKNQDLKSIDYKTYRSIYNEFEFITGRNFNIVPKKDNIIELNFNNDQDEWIPAKNCGLGLSDILIIIGLVNLAKANIYLIEEPENHLHAEYQKKLLDFFRRQKDKQFFLSTHSNIFIDTNIVSKVIYTQFNGKVSISDVTSRSVIISSLGYSISDNLSSDLIILTEGPTDVPIIKEILMWKGIDLLFNIKYWPLGGDVMNKLDLEVLAQDHSLIALIDSDPGSKASREEFKENCDALKIKCFQLKRYAIENYLSIDAIRAIFTSQVPSSLLKIDPKKAIKKQLGFNIKSKNYQIIKRMSPTDFENTDLLEFCNLVEAKLKQNVT